MTLLATSDKPISNFVKWEQPKNLSRKTVTLNVAAETTIKVGTVLGAVTADGKYKIAVETAVDGSESFAGILVALPENEAEFTFAAATDYEIVVLEKDAMVAYEGLIVDSTYDNSTKVDALKAEMEAAGVRVAENRPVNP